MGGRSEGRGAGTGASGGAENSREVGDLDSWYKKEEEESRTRATNRDKQEQGTGHKRDDNRTGRRVQRGKQETAPATGAEECKNSRL